MEEEAHQIPKEGRVNKGVRARASKGVRARVSQD